MFMSVDKKIYKFLLAKIRKLFTYTNIARSLRNNSIDPIFTKTTWRVEKKKRPERFWRPDSRELSRPK